MNRSVKIERTFFLGQFKNIKITDEVTGIPEHLVLNPEFVDKLYFTLLLSVEIQYRNYQKLNLVLGDLSLETSLAHLDELKGSNIKSVKELIETNTANEKPKKEVVQ